MRPDVGKILLRIDDDDIVRAREGYILDFLRLLNISPVVLMVTLMIGILFCF
jgi:hypothetical protein